MWIIIIGLLVIGLALIVVEIIFIPGTTVVGVLGFIFAVAGIVICYKHFGSEVGFYTMIAMASITLATVFYSFRTGVWSKFSLKSTSESKVNEGMLAAINIGDEGTAISTLRPVGKAEFSNRQFEVKTLGGYIESGVRVRIKSILSHQIIVEPIN
jgi:membrane-bound ClpP family serine protease